MILPEHAGSGRAHVGKVGEMTALDSATGRATVTFDGGETVTITAGCLQYQVPRQDRDQDQDHAPDGASI